VFAAFGAGLVISFLELACTGQVYLPTIQFMLKAGQGRALGYLLIYNLAFIVPLIIVFALAFFGLRSDALIRFQKNHTATVKVLTGILFVVLAAMLVFGHQIIASFR
jgi:cytochrome c biogenesis protein CcdA